MKTIVAAMFMSVGLAGCAIYPVAPRWSADEIDAAAIQDAFLAADPEGALKRVQGVRQLLAQETDARQKAEIIASEATFYGTFLAALGVAIDKVGVRNTGAGAATLSGLFTGRYRLADQQVVFRKAEARAACLEKTLTPAVFDQNELERLTGDSRSQARATAESMKLDNAAILNAADNPALNRWALSEAETLVANASTGRERIPELTWRALRRLTSDLRIALAGIPLTPMTRDQMQQTINDAVTQEELAEGRAEAAIKSAGTPDPETARMLKELAAAAAVEATMEACFVEYPQ